MTGIPWVIPFVALFIYISIIYESTGFALLGITTAVFAVLSFIFLSFQGKKARADVDIRSFWAMASRQNEKGACLWRNGDGWGF